MAEGILQGSDQVKQVTGRFFKSVNLRLDSRHPDRFAHFQPTSKNAHVISSIIRGEPDPSSIIVASYGSGKSLSAGTAALIVENDPKARKQLKALAGSISAVDKKLGKFVTARTADKKRGLSIILEGFQDNLAYGLLSQAKERVKYLRAPKSSDPLLSLDAIAERARKQKMDRIAIIWDEFGEHLESLVSKGKAESLLSVQQVAEWVARQKNPGASLTLLLHQNLFQYAGNLSQAARASWRKIEGRFGSIRYVEDSNEIYGLIASVVSELRPASKLPGTTHFNETAKKCVSTGLFASFTPRKDLPKVISNSYPLLPATLHSLPKLASRLAQNERTIFSFLREADLSRPVSLLDVYQYFSSSMQADSGAGGSYRRWLETESALSKVSDSIEKELLAAAALLGLGSSGERTHVSKKSLAFAATGANGADSKAVNRAVDNLIKKKLLLYRKNNDDISVWHGTDIDVRSCLSEMRDSQEGHIDIVDFLDREQPALNWRPVEHNIKNSIRRYYQGRYVLVRDLIKLGKDHPALALNPGEDGAIVYCLAENGKELEEVRDFAYKFRSREKPRLIFVLPTSPLSVSGLVLEITSLRKLQNDPELIGKDPFVLPEIQHMIDDAHVQLSLVMQRLVQPDGDSNIWIGNGNVMPLNSSYELQHHLSKEMDRCFGSTPLINNELIVKHAVSRPMKNARKKLMLGILERTGLEHLGFDWRATTPDVTLYRTMLLNTGLYKNCGNAWKWSSDTDVKDNAGLVKVWQLLEDFFTEPSFGKSKSIADLIVNLSLPPYGVRKGVIPILFSASMMAFGRAIAIKHKGNYLPDILASQIEEICETPSDYSLDVFRFDNNFEGAFSDLIEIFSREQPGSGDLLRQFYDTVEHWKSRLPKPALTTRKVSKEAQSLQKAVRGEIDPVKLAFKELPAIAGSEFLDAECIPHLSSLVHEIEGIVDGYTTAAINSIYNQLAISPNSQGGMLQRAHEWASCYTADETLLSKYGQTARAILSRSMDATNGRFTEASFARALSAILLGKNFEQWDDASAQMFVDELREVVSSIEHLALMSPNPHQSLTPLVRGRIQYLQDVLARLESHRLDDEKPLKSPGKTKKKRTLRD